MTAHLDSARRDLPLRIGVLHCGILADNCNDRYFGFTAALNSVGIHWRLSGILEGWDATNAPPAAAKLLADDPAIDVLWAEKLGGTKALALAAASLPRPIIVLGTDRSQGWNSCCTSLPETLFSRSSLNFLRSWAVALRPLH